MIVKLITIFIMFINSMVRMLPIAFYSGSIMSFLVFEDNRAQLLFIGFILNELLAFAYKSALSGVNRAECALMHNQSSYFVLPASITQTVGFFFGFILYDTYKKNDFEALSFIALVILFTFTIFSRINVGCESLITALTFGIVGVFLGLIYYYIVSDYYLKNIEDLEMDNTFM